MMKRISEFFKTHHFAVKWTACYIASMWAILYFLFRFNMFNPHQWQHLMRAELHGFAGFVFGILLLSALPLYVACTTLIIRTKKPLVTIPTKHIKKFLARLQPVPVSATSSTDTTETDVAEKTDSDTPHVVDSDLPENIPAELRPAYIRMRSNLGRMQTSTFNSLSSNPIPQIITTADTSDTTNDNSAPVSTTDTPVQTDIIGDTMPLPSDFDLDIPDDTPIFSDIPTFTDITFGDGDDDANEPETTTAATTVTTPPVDIANYLTNAGIPFTTTDTDLIKTDKYIIASHTDPDFWVADAQNWFASGKIRPSPIQEIQAISATENLTPVLYLGSDNIMDLDQLIQTWEQDGILIIRTPSDL